MKRKKLKQLISAFTAAAMAVTFVPFNVFSANNVESNANKIVKPQSKICAAPVYNVKTKADGALSNDNKTLKFRNAFSKAVAMASDVNVKYDAAAIDTNSLPAKYDLRDSGLISSVKNQNPYGTCWSFGTLASVESQLVKRNPLVDLSELHLAYFTYTGDTAFDNGMKDSGSIYDNGGLYNYAAATLAQWAGIVNETLVPYDSGDELDESLRFASDYHLQDAYHLASWFDGDIAYTADEIKQLVKENNAVSISFCYDDSFFNYEKNAYYCNTASFANHCVAIAGWDDNYSKDNFGSAADAVKPLSDGAWLVKNSWGANWGDSGYFWMSYEDASLCDASCFFVESKDNYAKNYQYDTFGWGACVSADLNESLTSSMANIFTAESDEEVCAAAFYTTDNNAQYEITVYTDLTDTDSPVSGKASIVTKGTELYSGYHTIELGDSVDVSKGENYSVVVKLTNPEVKYPIPVEASINQGMEESSYSNISKEKLMRNTGDNESFISLDGNSWTNTKGLYYDYTQVIDEEAVGKTLSSIIDTETSDTTETSITYDIYLGNVCLKAFTNPSEKVTFSQDGGEIAKGEQVKLSAYGTVHYTTDGTTPDENSPIYKDPITIDGNMTISAVAVNDGVTGEVYTETYTISSAFPSSIVLKGFSDGSKSDAVSVDIASKYAEISQYNDSVSVNAYGSCDITVNGKELENNTDSDLIPIKYGYSTISFTFTENGKLSTSYDLSVYRPFATINNYSEMISFDSKACTVKSPNGHIFAPDDKVSDYTGQILTITPADGSKILNITVPQRKDKLVRDFSLDYKDALLYGIFTADDAIYYLNNMDSNIYYADSADIYSAVSVGDILEGDPDFDTSQLNDENLTNEEYCRLIAPHLGVPIEGSKTYYFWNMADEEYFASKPLTYTTPAAPTAPKNLLKVNKITDNLIECGLVDKVQYSVKEFTPYTYTEDEIAEMLEYMSEAEVQELIEQAATPEFTEWQDSCTFEDLIPGTGYAVAIRYIGTETALPSPIEFKCVNTTGIRPIAIIDYYGETITFDVDTYTVTDSDGNTIDSYIGDNCGEDLTITNNETGEVTLFPIPARPTVPDITIDFIHGTSNEVLPENASAIMPVDGIFLPVNEEGKLCNLDEYAGKEFTLIIEPTKTQFSNYKAFTIPAKEQTPDNVLSFVSNTTNSIELTAVENALYSISDLTSPSEEKLVWQESPLFTDLTPTHEYTLYLCYAATETAFATIPASANIRLELNGTLKAGDVSCDGGVSPSDALLILKYSSESINLSAEQIEAADVDGNGSVTSFDALLILQYASEKIDSFPSQNS